MMVFLTTNVPWSAQSVADLYRCRWDIEVFFKERKQTGRRGWRVKLDLRVGQRIAEPSPNSRSPEPMLRLHRAAQRLEVVTERMALQHAVFAKAVEIKIDRGVSQTDQRLQPVIHPITAA
jgi:hypothetical protein